MNEAADTGDEATLRSAERDGPRSPEAAAPHLETEKFGADPIESRHGRVNRWLGLVYLVMFVWALYYGYVYWGGLGPGLDLDH